MRNCRWREVEVRHHERDDGTAVRYVEPHDRSERAFAWIGLGPARWRRRVPPRGTNSALSIYD